MRVIIAGGRDYDWNLRDSLWVDGLHDTIGPFTEIISGGASGADSGGESWAAHAGLPVKRFPADWKAHGRAAGPIRNKHMAEYAAPNGLCLLFPGGRGTASMKREAQAAGLTILSPPWA